MDTFEFESDEKTILFIDGYNLYTTARNVNLEIDFGRFLKFFKDQAPVVRAYYYTTMPEEGTSVSIQPLVDWLDYNGFDTITKPVREYSDTNGQRRFKGSISVDMTVKAMQMAQYCDHIVLVTGDGDFLPLVRALQDFGKKVTICSTTSTSVPMVADALRRAADYFIDIKAIEPNIARVEATRPTARKTPVAA